MPEEFPAVTWPSGPVSEGNAASFSGVRVPARVFVHADRHGLAPTRRHRHRHDLRLEATQSVACTARMFEWYDQSSDSSRVMPHSRAVFSPTVINMLVLGASAESG